MSAPATDVGTQAAKASLAGTWQIDPVHSGLEFVVTHLMISKVRGRFSSLSGTVVTDGTPEGSKIDVEISTASISTHDDGRDTHLRSASDYEMMLRILVKYKMLACYIPEVVVKMRTGGISNASMRNRLRANREDREAWRMNGLHPYFFTLYLKPLRKITQFIIR